MTGDAERELNRVVERLRTMPLGRLAVAAPLAYDACRAMLAVIGEEHPLPRLADHAAADQVSVIAADSWARADGADAQARIVEILTELRRALP